MALFDGLSAFPITPADEDGRVDTEGLCRLLARLESAGVQSIGLLGSTGIYAYLSRSERKRAIEGAASCVGGKLPLITGIGALRTDDAVALARDANDAGADALLLAPVSYTPLTEEEVYQHFSTVAGATDLPLCIYNNPGTTNFTFSNALLKRLSQLPTITAVKMPLPSDGDVAANLRDLQATLPSDFLIGYSGDWGCAAAMLAGADTWYSVVAGTLPEPALRLTRAAISGDTAEAGRIDHHFQPLWALFKEFGSLRVMYAVAHLLSLTRAQPPRPLLPLPATEMDRVAEALDRLTALR
jgi:4-hydroxy-tetrahydrodipicolinate synthase